MFMVRMWWLASNVLTINICVPHKLVIIYFGGLFIEGWSKFAEEDIREMQNKLFAWDYEIREWDLNNDEL